MSDKPEPKQKKIIVDEDWKNQVEAEKESLRKEQETPKSSTAGSTSDHADPLPPPTLTFLAGTFYLQGMVSLGLLPSPASEKPEVHLDQAKHAIDTLQMLQEKTEGNRTADEDKELDTILHQLRLAYVAVMNDE